ncbi:hypothetical protein B0H11DRAFT_1924462 [Mycena galericulata]|nr:hypothetical protein B0H11DRAFT_1924462 [Mycena galericulata]
MSPPPVVGKKALLFPWGVTGYHLINIDYPADAVTLGANDGAPLDAVFEPNPAACSRCLKPYLKHHALPNFGFSVFTGCTHGTDLEWEKQYPNKCVAALLPNPLQTCFGCVVVVKHPLSTDPAVSNRDLPVLDVEQADIPHLTELVRRVSEFRRPKRPTDQCSAAPYNHASVHLCLNLRDAGRKKRIIPQPGRAKPDKIICFFEIICFSPCDPFCLAFFCIRSLPVLSSSSCSASMASGSTTPPLPVYDIDEIIASLTLEEQAEVERPRRRRRRHARTSDGSSTRVDAPPSTPPRASTPTPDQPLLVTPSSTPTIYQFSSPTKCGYTEHWSEAAHASQAADTKVRAVRQPRKKRTKNSKKAAEEVEDATSGFRFAIHKGYSSRETAVAAFEHAVSNAWTSTAADWTSLPVSLTRAPLPIADATTSPLPDVATRNPQDPCVECSLNVLGIHNAVHESVPTFSKAQAKFGRAQRRGEVSIQRRRAD